MEGEAEKMANLESFRDYRGCQPMDYAIAFQRLHINPDHPRDEGMPAVAELKSWQITGIDATISKRKERKKCAFLCDATGLGNTGACLVSIITVSWILGISFTKTP
jgi:hypothetical protein